MPIYRDPDEPEYEGIEPCPHLEEWTGADFMVTPSKLPVSTRTLILAHVQKSGAVLVQVKRGGDLFSSLGPRVNSSLARMRLSGAHKHQCLLLTCGVYVPDAQGEAWLGRLRYSAAENKPYIVSQPANDASMKAVYTELRRWGLRGGSYMPLASESDFLPFMCDLEKDLCTLPAIREVWPMLPEIHTTDPDDPLQELKLVRDKGLIMLAALIGPAKAKAALSAWGDLSTALMWLSNPETFEEHRDMYPEGIGPKTVAAVKSALGGSVERASEVQKEIQ